MVRSWELHHEIYGIKPRIVDSMGFNDDFIAFFRIFSDIIGTKW